VQVCSPAVIVTLSLIPTIPSPDQFLGNTEVWLNFPSVTTSLASPPAGFTPATFPFTVEVVPTPMPTATGSLQVIGS
jgi:hypothetical protein